MIRKRLEEHRPKNFRGRPFGVGDVIVINQQGEITAYFVDPEIYGSAVIFHKIRFGEKEDSGRRVWRCNERRTGKRGA